MPFSSLVDPTAIAKAQVVFDRAWLRLQAKGLVSTIDDRARQRLAAIVTSLSSDSSEDDRVDAAVRRFIDR